MTADQLRDLAAATYLTSLRAKRSNPSCRAKKKHSILPSKERVDCFVAYAPRNDGRQLRDLAAATYLTSLRANGLRECAPYDRLLAMTAGASELRLHFSNSPPRTDTASRSRRTFSREFCWSRPALCHQRAQGMPGAQCARGLACKIKQAYELVTTVTPERPGIPRAMVLRLTSRSPR